MKIVCRNCNDKTQTKHTEAMMEAGFAIWHIECQACGEKALAKDERAEFAAIGGSTKSKAKTKTARANGAKGGRPRNGKWICYQDGSAYTGPKRGLHAQDSRDAAKHDGGAGVVIAPDGALVYWQD